MFSYLYQHGLQRDPVRLDNPTLENIFSTEKRGVHLNYSLYHLH